MLLDKTIRNVLLGELESSNPESSTRGRTLCLCLRHVTFFLFWTSEIGIKNTSEIEMCEDKACVGCLCICIHTHIYISFCIRLDGSNRATKLISNSFEIRPPRAGIMAASTVSTRQEQTHTVLITGANKGSSSYSLPLFLLLSSPDPSNPHSRSKPPNQLKDSQASALQQPTSSPRARHRHTSSSPREIPPRAKPHCRSCASAASRTRFP